MRSNEVAVLFFIGIVIVLMIIGIIVRRREIRDFLKNRKPRFVKISDNLFWCSTSAIVRCRDWAIRAAILKTNDSFTFYEDPVRDRFLLICKNKPSRVVMYETPDWKPLGKVKLC